MKGVSSGSGGRANRVTSDNEGRKLVSFGFRVFSGSFWRNLVKCYVSVQVTYLLDSIFIINMSINNNNNNKIPGR